MRMSPCPDCARHVRDDGGACPFCGSVAPRPAPREPRRSARPVTRAALFLAGVLGAGACGDGDRAEPAPRGGAASSDGEEDDPGMADIYGGPPAPVDEDPASDEGMQVEAYGAPAPPPDTVE